MIAFESYSNIKGRRKRDQEEGGITKNQEQVSVGKRNLCTLNEYLRGDFGYALPLSIIRIMRGDSGF
jgi:hypothetical protein